MTYQGAASVQRFLGPEMWKMWRRKNRHQAPVPPENLPDPLRSKTICPDPEGSKAGLCEASELIPDNPWKTWTPGSGWWCLADMGNAIREQSCPWHLGDAPVTPESHRKMPPSPRAPGTPDHWGLVSLVLVCSLGSLGHASQVTVSSPLNVTRDRLPREWDGKSSAVV